MLTRPRTEDTAADTCTATQNGPFTQKGYVAAGVPLFGTYRARSASNHVKIVFRRCVGFQSADVLAAGRGELGEPSTQSISSVK